MARGRSKRNGEENTKSNGATLGFEAKLWQAADALRNNMDAAEYKHVVLGLIFLKYISDAFEAKHAELDAQRGDGADPERPGRVPRRKHLLGAAGGALVISEGRGTSADDRADRR
jgi:type I restriction enzyme M protein